MATEDYSSWRTCAIAVPEDQQNSDLAEEHVVAGIGGAADGSPSFVVFIHNYRQSLAILTKLDELWPTGTNITFAFLSGTANQQQKVKDTIQEWTKYANITFTALDNAQSDDAFVRISFDPTKGSWSYTGTVAKNILPPNATMNLGWISNTTTADDIEKATILHEFGHVLGLMHEHQSPARNGKLTLDKEACYAYFGAIMGWSEEVIDAQVLNVYNNADISNYSVLDLTSIMMFFFPPQLTKEHIGVSPNLALSDMDKAFLCINYPRSIAKPADPALGQWTLEQALEVAKVDEDTKNSILSKVGQPSQIRSIYTAYLANERAKAAMGDPTSGQSPPNSPGQGSTDLPDQGNGDQPGHGLGPGNTGITDTPVANLMKQLAVQIDSMKDLFSPGGAQQFVLQFPARFLDIDTYAWDTQIAGIYGQFVKPTVVNEAEFRLVDQMYDIQDRVGGPNGINLSIVYEEVLNNLIPKPRDNKLPEQQAQIRQWLLKPVEINDWIQGIIDRQNQRETALAAELTLARKTQAEEDAKALLPPSNEPASDAPSNALDPTVVDPSGKKTITRIELSEILMNDYLYAKQDWELERDTLIRQANQADLGTPESQKALNDLTRKLSHITAVRQAQLAAKYSDAVVRGFSHNIREYMGYMDIMSPAEALQNAKDSLRESAASSLDGSLKVYPVQLSPQDWWQGLSTSFTLEDLTEDVFLIRNQIDAKSEQLDTLISQRTLLEFGTKGDPAKLQAAVASAQSDLDNATSDLASQYTTNIIEMAKTYLNAQGELDAQELANKLGVVPDTDLYVKILNELGPGLKKVQEKQNALLSASRALSTVLSAQALAEASDSRARRQTIQIQIEGLERDVKELQARWAALMANKTTIPSPPTTAAVLGPVPEGAPTLPTEATSGGSRWQTVHITNNEEYRNSHSSDYSAATSLGLVTSGLLLEADRPPVAPPILKHTARQATKEVNLAFRATLVTVDRGGWFQPQFFKQSEAFYHVDDKISWNSEASKLLPGFPVSFVIVKDCIIRVKFTGSDAADQASFAASQSASAGGCLCFSYSKSSSSRSESRSSAFTAYNNGFEVKIPGPQIIGYIIEKTDTDRSTVLQSLPLNFLPKDEDGGNDPSHGLDPGAPTQTDEEKAEEKIHTAMSKLLEDRLNEIFSAVKTEVDQPAKTTT
ncbi:hypothetical protein DL96DRAFT_1551871 [Flagelloscypha sp. PMI_526]|nr:hypothetical protein DL96DRAFT_1551871 [Flagelloscypha sp. PMI_526]